MKRFNFHVFSCGCAFRESSSVRFVRDTKGRRLCPNHGNKYNGLRQSCTYCNTRPVATGNRYLCYICYKYSSCGGEVVHDPPMSFS